MGYQAGSARTRDCIPSGTPRVHASQLLADGPPSLLCRPTWVATMFETFTDINSFSPSQPTTVPFTWGAVEVPARAGTDPCVCAQPDYRYKHIESCVCVVQGCVHVCTALCEYVHICTIASQCDLHVRVRVGTAIHTHCVCLHACDYDGAVTVCLSVQSCATVPMPVCDSSHA